jgi:hypothetical protein
MMFQSGKHALQCKRFFFGESELDGKCCSEGKLADLSLADDPGLAGGRRLAVHAIRLDKVQHILAQSGQYWAGESHAQMLFQHILNNLLVDILREGEISCSVINATGMKDMVVNVERFKDATSRRVRDYH